MPGLVDLTVAEVRTAVPARVGVEAGLVVLKEKDGPEAPRFLRIVIGQPEARAIKTAWEGTAAQRPGTWDLFVTGLELLDGRVVTAVIDAVEQERHFYAHLEISREDPLDLTGEHTEEQPKEPHEEPSEKLHETDATEPGSEPAQTETTGPADMLTLPCRPSDAIALALRTPGASICAQPDVLNEAGVLADGTKPPPRPTPLQTTELSSAESPGSPLPPPFRL